MYVDERKEFLSDIEKRAKNELEQQDEPKEGYREGLQRRLSHSLRPQVLTHKHNRFTAMWGVFDTLCRCYSTAYLILVYCLSIINQ